MWKSGGSWKNEPRARGTGGPLSANNLSKDCSSWPCFPSREGCWGGSNVLVPSVSPHRAGGAAVLPQPLGLALPVQHSSSPLGKGSP